MHAAVVEHQPIALERALVHAPAEHDAAQLPARSVEHAHSGSTFPPSTENAIENT